MCREDGSQVQAERCDSTLADAAAPALKRALA
jgi:hypothetical protein